MTHAFPFDSHLGQFGLLIQCPSHDHPYHMYIAEDRMSVHIVRRHESFDWGERGWLQVFIPQR
jgi:hypothetical protein